MAGTCFVLPLKVKAKFRVFDDPEELDLMEKAVSKTDPNPECSSLNRRQSEVNRQQKIDHFQAPLTDASWPAVAASITLHCRQRRILLEDGYALNRTMQLYHILRKK